MPLVFRKERLDANPDAMRTRREAVEHPSDAIENVALRLGRGMPGASRLIRSATQVSRAAIRRSARPTYVQRSRLDEPP